MKNLLTLWKFSRPHTIIGSVISILTLYSMACRGDEAEHLPLLMMAIIIGIGSNIFIVGINQIADVEIDKINKPYLPIPAGELSIRHARYIVYISLTVSLSLSIYLSPYLFGIIALSTTIGWAYSMPPFYLKQHHLPAAIAITTVRGVLVNAGGFMIFNLLINQSSDIPEDIMVLTMFIIAFSMAISWFKDLPDMKGDAQHHIKTFALLYSPKLALILGHVLVGLAYLITIYMKYMEIFLDVKGRASIEDYILLYGHIFLFCLFILNAFSIQAGIHLSVRKFYKRFWWFFFAEYLIYLIVFW